MIFQPQRTQRTQRVFLVHFFRISRRDTKDAEDQSPKIFSKKSGEPLDLTRGVCYNSKIIRGKPRIFDNSVESLEAKECRRVIPAYSTERVRGRLDLTGLQHRGLAASPLVHGVQGAWIWQGYSHEDEWTFVIDGCTGCLDLTGLQRCRVSQT